MLSKAKAFTRSLMNIFKVCPCCGKMYINKADFLSETDFIGNMAYLKLYNCACGSTLAVKSVD